MNMDLPFHRSWFEEDEINEVVDTLRSGWLTTGPKTQRFEEGFKDYIGCRHAVALNSCTAGLHLALASMGFKEGSEVITTPMTFPATSNIILHERMKPIFVDIEPGTLTIDAQKIEDKITPRTVAILPVHFAGHPCDMDVIQDIASRHKLAIIEDAAHGLETGYKGRKIGNLGNPTSFSFYANKNITTGEGGMLVTDDDAMADKVREMRLQGLSKDAWKRYGKDKFSHWELKAPGFKYNMPDINASLGIHQLKRVNAFLDLRRRYVALYDEAFSAIPEVETLVTRDFALHAHHIYIISLKLKRLTLSRNEFLTELQGLGIGAAVHYVALHLQPYYRNTFHTRPEDFPIASEYSERVLTLPLYPKMSVGDVNRVIEVVSGLIEKFRR